MEPWPDNAFLQGYYEPLTAECSAPDLVIEGEMPKDLNGTFYRNGPNPQFPPKNEYHFFTGDGMVHAFKFDNGNVSHMNRWAQTERFKIEKKLGGSYFSGMNPLETDPRLLDFVLTDKEGVANTSIIYHGGRLLLLEEGHLPFEMDPPDDKPQSLKEAVSDAEIRTIKAALARYDGAIAKAAQSLGVSRKSLWEKMRRYDIRN